MAPVTSPSDLARWQAEVARISSGARLHDLMISPRDAADRIKSLDTADLHRAIRTIGLADSTDILAMASSEQVRGIIDVEAWSGDTLSIERLDPWLAALTQAGPVALVQHVMALDDEVINWVMRRSVRVIVVEDPEDFDPPDTEHVMTPDHRMCIYFPNPGPRDLPIKVFLDNMMRVDPGFTINLLIHSDAALDSVLQEQAYRWRSGRMADRGYVDPYEALKVYAPPRPDEITSARAVLPEGAPLGRWVRPLVGPEARLERAVQRMPMEDQALFQQGLAYLVNTALSADRVELWDEEAVPAVYNRVRAGLALGLDALAGAEADPGADARLLAGQSPSFVFRTGYARTLEAAAPARQAAQAGLLRGEGGLADAVDIEPLRAWAFALTARHPALLEEAPMRSPADVDQAARSARAVAELARVAGSDRLVEVGMGSWVATRMALARLGLPEDGLLPANRLAEAWRAFFADGQLTDEARAGAEDWWLSQGGGAAGALPALLAALTSELARLNPETLEPRFVQLWRVGA